MLTLYQGFLDISFDWNYISFWQPLYTPLWANANQIIGAAIACYAIYPIMYFANAMNALNYAAMSSDTFDDTGAPYNITLILNPDNTLNQTAMDNYSRPYWSASYAFTFFCGFAASTGAMLYACLFYGKSSWRGLKESISGRRERIDDPYLELMEHLPRVPHWWYGLLLLICGGLSIGQLYGGEMQLPWW
jgi:hypothetical protein